MKDGTFFIWYTRRAKDNMLPMLQMALQRRLGPRGTQRPQESAPLQMQRNQMERVQQEMSQQHQVLLEHPGGCLCLHDPAVLAPLCDRMARLCPQR